MLYFVLAGSKITFGSPLFCQGSFKICWGKSISVLRMALVPRGRFLLHILGGGISGSLLHAPMSNSWTELHWKPLL